jgi:diguanylate cyclase (GGDEF)-like protein
MLGRSDDELMGEGFADCVHHDDVASVRAIYADGDPPSEMVFRLRNKFGETRVLEAHITDLRQDRRIKGVVMNARDITERVQLEDELTRQAFHDGLTGLANRALFRDRLDQGLARSARSASTVCVLLIDLDGFKQVNDTFGHPAGDALLARLGGRLRDAVRAGEAYRMGGDEFCLLAPCPSDGPEEIVERACAALSEQGVGYSVGTSVGVAILPRDATEVIEALNAADKRLYANKHERKQGREDLLEV